MPRSPPSSGAPAYGASSSTPSRWTSSPYAATPAARAPAGPSSPKLTADAPEHRAWLLTARAATDTVATYRRLGWHEVTPLPGTENAVIVFLSPHHPEAAEATLAA
ncbi:hypothetical protein ABT084_29015 [Streptomyces sp. NPDC002138]|uniref:hypothetical protein n=1 Tax=Streptomyces sp. NPDC002138 TaxID=3154410 RepID=UPI003331186C